MLDQSTLAHNLSKVLAKIKRWKTRSKRAQTELAKLDQQQRRIERAIRKLEFAKLVIPPALTVPREVKPPLHNVVEVVHAMLTGSAKVPDIPDFLRRQAASKKRDEVAAEAIKAEQAERKLMKARARVADMKAKKSGETKKMPLTGKAALAAISQ